MSGQDINDFIGRSLPPHDSGHRRWWLEGHCDISIAGCGGHDLSVTIATSSTYETREVILDDIEEALALALAERDRLAKIITQARDADDKKYRGTYESNRAARVAMRRILDGSDQ